MRSNSTKSGNSVSLSSAASPPAAPNLPSATPPPYVGPVFIPRTVKGAGARTFLITPRPNVAVVTAPAVPSSPAAAAGSGSGSSSAAVLSSPAAGSGAAYKTPSPVVYKTGMQPPTTPVQPKRHRDILSPSTYAVFFIPPDINLFDRVNLLTAIDIGLAGRVSKLLRDIYYPLLRPGDPSSVSIGGALATERKDHTMVNGARHDIKAAGYIKPLTEIIAELDQFKLSRTGNNEEMLLTEFHEYFTLQLNSLLGELKRLSDAKKIQVEHHLKRKFREWLYKSPPPKTPVHRKLVALLHNEKLLHTPEKELTPRSHAIRNGLREKADELAAIVRGDVPPPELVDAKAVAKPAAIRTTKKRKRELDFTLAASTAADPAAGAKEEQSSTASPFTPESPVTATPAVPLAAERQAVKLTFKSPGAAAEPSGAPKVKLSQLPNIFAKLDAARNDPNDQSKKAKLDVVRKALAADAKAHGIESLPTASSPPVKR
jgi:hypothetical protein